MTMQTKAAVGSGGQERSAAGSSRLQAHSTIPARGGQVHAAGKVVGEVRAGVFHKIVRSSAHMLRKPPAWALGLDSLLEAERLGAQTVALHDMDTGRTYTASVDLIRRRGFTFDRGHGRQVGLSLACFTVTEPNQQAMVQLGLFGAEG